MNTSDKSMSDGKDDLRIIGDYGFFWGGWLSNWAITPFTYGLREYNCVEQWIMAQKARAFGDFDSEKKIMESPHPKAQKEFGRKVTPYNDKQWALIRRAVAFDGLLCKFQQNPELKAKLISFQGTYVEASPYDKIWGIGMGVNEPGIEDPKNWKGANLLGETITDVRNEIEGKTQPWC